MSEKIEYRVRPVTRYVVTRYEEHSHPNGNPGGGCCTKGEFDNEETAYAVAYALARHEHEQKGWPVGDERIQYPAPIAADESETAPAAIFQQTSGP